MTPRLKNIALYALATLSMSGCAATGKPQFFTHNNMYTNKAIYSQCSTQDTANVNSINAIQSLDPENISLLNWNIYKGKLTNWQQDLHSFLDYTNHKRTEIFGNAVDHVFYRGLEPISHHSWEVNSSDHNPTHASFRLL
jgi:hypothetical protein